MATTWQMNMLWAGLRHFQVIQWLLWCFGSLIIWFKSKTDHWPSLPCAHNSSSKHTSALRITRGLGLLLKNVKGDIFTCTFLVCSYEIFTKHKHILVTPTTISAQCSCCPNPVTARAFWVRFCQHPFLYGLFQSLLSLSDSVAQTFVHFCPFMTDFQPQTGERRNTLQGLPFGKACLPSSHTGLDIAMGHVESSIRVPVEGFHCWRPFAL